MRERMPLDITSKEYNVEEFTINLFPFPVTLDGEFLPASPERLLNESAFSSDKAVLIGTNANEGFWSLMYLLTDVFPNEELSESERTLSEREYQQSVQTIFSFYPSMVMVTLLSVKK